MSAQRFAAIVALVVGAATVVLGVVVAVSAFPRGLGLLACVVVAAAAAWYGVLRRGAARVAGFAIAVPGARRRRGAARRGRLAARRDRWSWRGSW